MAMEECAENLSSITHFAPATTAGLRSKCLWQYFGGVKDVAGKKVPHGLGVKRFAHERTQSHLTRVESGRWVLGELDGCPSLPTPASSHCNPHRLSPPPSFAFVFLQLLRDRGVHVLDSERAGRIKIRKSQARMGTVYR